MTLRAKPPPTMAPDPLLRPLTLPCGQVLPNRLAKAAMTERLSGPDYAPGPLHETLYRRWTAGHDGGPGMGLQLTGNMLVDHRYLESGGNIAPLYGEQREALARMAAAARSGGGRAWVQLNHPGRQCSRFNSGRPVAPSAVPLRKLGLFARPRALAADELPGIVDAFARSARTVVEAGFDGVQVHAAHGYLLSQFLSPVTNRRTDAWGGDLEGRARLLLETVRAVRAAVGTHVPVSVKLNSADFQRGGFGEDDALEVAGWLAAEGIDLLEISGGNYERLVFFDPDAADTPRASTREREAYFLAFAERLRAALDLPLMLTGGFRTRAGMEAALASGAVDVVGVARPCLVDPAFGGKLLAGALDAVPVRGVQVGFRSGNDLAEAGYWDHQIERIARGLDPRPDLGGWAGLWHITRREAGKGLRKRLGRALGG